MRSHRIVVRDGASRRWIWVVVALSLTVVVGSAALYRHVHQRTRAPLATEEELPRRVGGSELDQLREERRRLTRELHAARDEVQNLRGRGAFEARSCAIDVQACEAVRQSVTSLEREVADLREQLAFYRNIVSPEQASAGVRVLSFAVKPSGAADTWHYELVLVQPVRRDRTATGSYDLVIEGLLGKQLQSLSLQQVRRDEPASDAFSFRSFQELSGDLKLPAGFLPSRIKVTLTVRDTKAQPNEVVESFDWPRLVAAGKE